MSGLKGIARMIYEVASWIKFGFYFLVYIAWQEKSLDIIGQIVVLQK